MRLPSLLHTAATLLMLHANAEEDRFHDATCDGDINCKAFKINGDLATLKTQIEQLEPSLHFMNKEVVVEFLDIQCYWQSTSQGGFAYQALDSISRLLDAGCTKCGTDYIKIPAWYQRQMTRGDGKFQCQATNGTPMDVVEGE